MTRLALCLAAALPLTALAQEAAAPGQPAPAVVTAPAAAAAPAPVKVELGGFLAWSAFTTFGALDKNDLPRAALPPSNERTGGMSVRQSRVRAAVGLPADGLLTGARLDGLVEVDFLGGYANGDQSLPIVRLRHGWASATWQDLGHLSVLVGQSWGLVGGPNAPLSLGHLAVPRFSGAGYLYRRAPQVRVSVESAGPLSVEAQVAVLAPIDRATSPAATPAMPDRPPATSVGERSGLTDLEGRLALRWRPGGDHRAELGLSGHAGREKWRLTAGEVDATVDSYCGALDARLDLHWLTLQGGLFYGKNLDVLSTLAPGITLSLDARGASLAATGVETWGGWGQAVARPLPWLTLLAGLGSEAADRSTLPANPASATVARANLQVSGGALVELSSRLQAGLEYTAYRTTWAGLYDRELTSGQLEVSSRFTF